MPKRFDADGNDTQQEDDIDVPSSEKSKDNGPAADFVFTDKINDTFNSVSDTKDQTTPDKTKHDASQTTDASQSPYDKFLYVEQRAKIFRSHDKVLWMLAVADIGNGGSSENSSVDTRIASSVFDENYTIMIGDKFGKNMKSVARPTGLDDVLLITKCLDEHLNFHKGHPMNSLLDNNVFWAVYFDTNLDKFAPITGVYYFDFWFDADTHALDLIFWSNVYTNDLKDKNKNVDFLYDGLKGPQEADLFDTTRPNGPIQRAVFHCRGTYRDVVLSNKSSDNKSGGSMKFGMTQESSGVVTGMYLFSRPVLLLNPGPSNSDTTFGDPVVDKIPFNTTKFVELK